MTSPRIRPSIFIVIICKTLIEAFKAHYYFGASEASPIQTTMSMAQPSDQSAPDATRAWFEVMWRQIDNKDSKSLPEAENFLVRETINSVKADFGPSLRTPWAGPVEEQLGVVFKKAIDLFPLLHRQEARHFVDMVPARGRTFVSTKMEVLLSESELAGMVGREIEASIFPAVYLKKGVDGMGGDEDLMEIVKEN